MLDANEDWKEYGTGQFRLNNVGNEHHVVVHRRKVHRIILKVKLFLKIQVFFMQGNVIRFGTPETNTNEDGKVETKMVNCALKLRSSTRNMS